MNEFWNGFVYGCLATLLIEIFAVVVYAVKKGGKK